MIEFDDIPDTMKEYSIIEYFCNRNPNKVFSVNAVAPTSSEAFQLTPTPELSARLLDTIVQYRDELQAGIEAARQRYEGKRDSADAPTPVEADDAPSYGRLMSRYRKAMAANMDLKQQIKRITAELDTRPPAVSGDWREHEAVEAMDGEVDGSGSDAWDRWQDVKEALPGIIAAEVAKGRHEWAREILRKDFPSDMLHARQPDQADFQVCGTTVNALTGRGEQGNG